MRGTLGAVLRTALVVVGFVVLFGGIVSLAYPPLLSGVAPGDGPAATQSRSTDLRATGGGFGPSMFVSLGGIIWGLTIVSAGLAMPGQSPYRLIREQPFSPRQRTFTLLGAFFVVGLPIGVWYAIQTGVRSMPAVLATGVLAVVGGLLVLFGTAGGLKYDPGARQNS